MTTHYSHDYPRTIDCVWNVQGSKIRPDQKIVFFLNILLHYLLYPLLLSVKDTAPYIRTIWLYSRHLWQCMRVRECVSVPMWISEHSAGHKHRTSHQHRCSQRVRHVKNNSNNGAPENVHAITVHVYCCCFWCCCATCWWMLLLLMLPQLCATVSIIER